MIMQCPDYNDDDFEFFPAPADSEGLLATSLDLPGFLYRGVPQDAHRRTLRLDAPGVQATETPATIPRPRWQTVRQVTREFNMSELFFG